VVADHHQDQEFLMLPGTPRTFVGSTTFTVRGLTDDESRRELVERIAGVDHVASVTVDAASGTVTVTAADLIDRADIADAVAAAGFTVAP
jgi:copper chaperone CopZ